MYAPDWKISLDCAQSLSLDIGPCAAPFLTGSLCVLFDVHVVRRGRRGRILQDGIASGFDVLLPALRNPTMEVPAHIRAPFPSVVQVRKSMDMENFGGGASLSQIAKMRTDTVALTRAANCNNRCFIRDVHIRSSLRMF